MTFNTIQDKQNTDGEQDQPISVLQSGEKTSIKNNSNSHLISKISPLWILSWMSMQIKTQYLKGSYSMHSHLCIIVIWPQYG